MAMHTFTIDGIVITVDLPPFAEVVLADQVISPAEWLEGFAKMVSGKVANVKKRIVESELRLALEEGRVDQLPGTEDDIVQAVLNRPGHKTRAEREAEQRAAEEKLRTPVARSRTL